MNYDPTNYTPEVLAYEYEFDLAYYKGADVVNEAFSKIDDGLVGDEGYSTVSDVRDFALAQVRSTFTGDKLEAAVQGVEDAVKLWVAEVTFV